MMSVETAIRPFAIGARVIRERGRPIPGTVVGVWLDRRGCWHVRVRWDRTLSPGWRIAGDGTQHSILVATAVLPATEENIAARQAAWERSRARRAPRAEPVTIPAGTGMALRAAGEAFTEHFKADTP